MQVGFRSVVVGAALALLCGPAANAQQTTPLDQWPPPGVHSPGQDGVTPARLLWDVKPAYTAGALRAKIEGIVLMHCVVKTDGTVGAARVFKSLDSVHGLDTSALQALKQWRFAPGTKEGVAVPVLVFVEMSFSIGRSRPPAGWPPALATKVIAPWGGAEHEVDTPELRLRVSYPDGWHAHSDGRPSDLIFVHDGTGARSISVFRPKPISVRLDRWLSKAQLDQAVMTLKPTAGGSDLTGAGQVEIVNRLWFWVEAHLPTFDPASASLPPDLAAQPHWGTGRLWIFTTTAGSQMVQVSATLLYPRGMAASEMEEQTRQAGAEFAAILERLSITAR
jgi:TonB family protein